VTVQPIRTLHRVLADRGLALPVSGTIAEQTIAGAVSTATHGGSIHRGALSDYVDAVTMVRADGTIVACDRGQASFHGLVVSLGLLGILSTVTLRCVPLFRLQSRSYVRNAAEVFDDFDALQRGHEFVNMLYYPVTDQVEILAIDSAADETSGSENAGCTRRHRLLPRHRPGSRLRWCVALNGRREGAGPGGLEELPRCSAPLPDGWSGRVRRARDAATKCWRSRTVVKGAARAPGILRDMELAVPYERCGGTAYCATTSGPRMHFPCCRFTFAARRRRVVAQSGIQTGRVLDRVLACLRRIRSGADAVAARAVSLPLPLGKASLATPAYISAQYERWQDFLALRRQWDPDGTFGNETGAHAFGPAKTPSDEA
jgi:FAD/FMN-containing dehydrogenase